MWKQWAVLFLALAAVATLGLQYKSIRQVRAELAETRLQLAQLQTGDNASGPLAHTATRVFAADAGNDQRMAALEQAVAQLTRASDYLMERGQLPFATNKLAELHRKLTDANLPERERLQTLRLLRRNRSMTDDVIRYAASWMQTATDPEVREDIVEQLEDINNPTLRDPLLHLALNDPEPEVREQAMDNLRQYLSDPDVERKLWETCLNDPNPEVRSAAAEVLREGPMTDARRASLRERAQNAQSTFDERLTALHALQRDKTSSVDATASLVQLAQSTPDPFARSRVYDVFDGTRDASLLPWLFQGLQDANPYVRERLVDVVSDLRHVTEVEQSLRYLAENDPDPSVRKSASETVAQHDEDD